MVEALCLRGWSGTGTCRLKGSGTWWQVEELAMELDAMYKILEVLLPKLPHPFHVNVKKTAAEVNLPEGLAV